MVDTSESAIEILLGYGDFQFSQKSRNSLVTISTSAFKGQGQTTGVKIWRFFFEIFDKKSFYVKF